MCAGCAGGAPREAPRTLLGPWCACRCSRACSSCGWWALLLWLHCLVMPRCLRHLPLPPTTLCILLSRLLLQLLLAALLRGCLHNKVLLPPLLQLLLLL